MLDRHLICARVRLSRLAVASIKEGDGGGDGPARVSQGLDQDVASSAPKVGSRSRHPASLAPRAASGFDFSHMARDFPLLRSELGKPVTAMGAISEKSMAEAQAFEKGLHDLSTSARGLRRCFNSFHTGCQLKFDTFRASSFSRAICMRA